jgi:hypothetical protein
VLCPGSLTTNWSRRTHASIWWAAHTCILIYELWLPIQRCLYRCWSVHRRPFQNNVSPQHITLCIWSDEASLISILYWIVLDLWIFMFLFLSRLKIRTRDIEVSEKGPIFRILDHAVTLGEQHFRTLYSRWHSSETESSFLCYGVRTNRWSWIHRKFCSCRQLDNCPFSSDNVRTAQSKKSTTQSSIWMHDAGPNLNQQPQRTRSMILTLMNRFRWTSTFKSRFFPTFLKCMPRSRRSTTLWSEMLLASSLQQLQTNRFILIFLFLSRGTMQLS